jgi:hypothetical protein
MPTSSALSTLKKAGSALVPMMSSPSFAMSSTPSFVY